MIVDMVNDVKHMMVEIQMMKVDILVCRHADLNKNQSRFGFTKLETIEQKRLFEIKLSSFPYLIEYFALDPMSMMMLSVSFNKKNLEMK